MKVTLIITLLIALAYQQCPLNPNSKPLINFSPKLLNKTKNGEKLILGDLDDEDKNYIYVAKLKGTPFEMGKAFGQLFQMELKNNIKQFYKYQVQLLQKILANKFAPVFLSSKLTPGLRSLIYGLLDLNIIITRRYTKQRYRDQIIGMAQGSKIKPRDIERINIVPEIIKGACTVAGVWGPASLRSQTLHMRSLDWDAANPISNFPLITIYQPTNSNQIMHANVGWVGLIGVLTGISPYLSIGQKVWLPPKNSVKTTRYGHPWTYVLRDLLYDAKNMPQALNILSNAHRTCAIHLGIGANGDQKFRIFLYAQKVLQNYDDKNYTDYSQKYHPKRAGIAYFDKFIHPSNDSCVGSILASSMYGQWEMENLWRVLGQSHQTGDTQLVVFNLQTQQALVSYSRISVGQNEKHVEKAYLRSPILVNFNQLWKPVE